MITIFNKKLNTEIYIDDKADWVTFTPRYYDEIPYVIIELKHGFNFTHHASNCKDCKSFLNAFGTKTLDWYINFCDKTKRLDLSTLNSKECFNNQINFTISKFDYGTRLKLMIHPLSTKKKDIENYLAELIKDENYDEACLIRDLDK